MKKFLAALAGRFIGGRPKIIAVFGTTRTEVERGIRHAQTGGTDIPIWAWCREKFQEGAEPVSGCERFNSGRSCWFSRDLLKVQPALSIVAWTGKPGAFVLKLLPLAIPPFRVVVFNEADGFFVPRPNMVAIHLWRRVRDNVATNCRRMWSLVFRAGEQLRDGLNWIWESLFALLAFIAQWSAPLSHAAVRRVRNGRPSFVPFEGSLDDTFIEVTIPNRGWPRRAIRVAAMSSDAEFIVLRMIEEQDSAGWLIAVARQTNAFAVAKQSAHADWRKKVVNKHAFRRLQEGEVSEVFAPFSTLLVIRRKTLLRLGFPRAFTYGGALMILFWKSAAAGFRSLAVGHRGLVTAEPAMALEDAELAFHLTVSGALAALAPARPARFRGNVAWSPSHKHGFRGNIRVLVVSPYLPFPLSHGGAVRIYNICQSLAGRVDFVLACFREANETVCYEELHEVFREVYVVDADEKHSDSAVPKQVAEYRNAAMSDLIRSLCLDHKVDVVQLEYTQMAEFRDDTGGVPVILVEHDITFTLYEQLADFNSQTQTRKDYQRWLEFERSALQCCNQVWTMSPDEQSVALDHGAPRKGTRVIPNGVDLRRFTPAPKPAGPPTILFVGSFRHLPNLLAFESLRTSIMPAVWRECPDAVLHVIAGPHHERVCDLAGKAGLLAAHPRIVIDGFVADVRPAYRATDVVAVPLPLSAGTNIKLLEAMACGRAIVSTSSGCRGLNLANGRELFIAELDTSFPAAIVKLLRDEDLRASIARDARKAAELRFGWDKIGGDAFDCYVEQTGSQIGVHSRQLA